MKKITFFSVFVLAGMLAMYVTMSNASSSKTSQVALPDIESITSCELPDGYAPDGHCVHNDNYNYFCASPAYGELNCLQ